SILQSASFCLDKVILSVKKATHKQYLVVSFPLITLFTFIMFLIFNPPFNLELLYGKYLLLIILSISITIASNLIFYNALKKDFLGEIQIIELLKNFPLIIFAALIFPDERNYVNIILSLLAAGAVAWSHYEKKSFKITQATVILLLWNLIASPFRGIISKSLLEVWNPISLQLIIDGAISIVLLLLFYKKIKKLPKKAMPYLIITNILTSIAWVLYYYSYQASGIIYTVLIFSLQPILVYVASLIFFKEKFNYKKFTAFVIILISIIITQL
ncbi:MAG: EamA family transporter, partial [Candidatus Nanoarchaeia archaeon]|nr:EamA family transporter [Candidatus Nanoarchaeia archaeon]